MQFLNRHILAFGQLFLVLFFLANSGFTMVVSHCTTAGGASELSCCTERDPCPAGACKYMQGPHPPVTHAVMVGQPCQTSTVAGGQQTKPTIAEKKFSGRQIIKIDLLPTSAYKTLIDHRVDLPAFYPPSATSNVSQLSVEAYVLNSTFVI